VAAVIRQPPHPNCHPEAEQGLHKVKSLRDTTAKTVLEENTPLVAKVASDFDLPLPPSSR